MRQRPEPLVWGLVALWVTLPATMGWALAEALDERSDAVARLVTVGAWSGWTAVLIALLVPTTVSLTMVRLTVPLAPVVAVLAAFRGASPGRAAVALGASLAAVVVVASADVGRRFVQGSAYGDETRFPLRPPGPLLPVLVIGWLLAAAGVVAGPLLMAAGPWPVGLVVTAAGAGWAWLFARRCHRLTRRFLVFVPAGFVVHDHVVLTDTALFLVADVAGFRLAPADTGAADLTGRALGNAIEFTLRQAGTIVLVDPSTPGGRAIHLTAGLVSPSRPGRVLDEAGRRGHPVR